MKIVFVDGDDWQGLFVDGKCVLQDHSLDARTVLRALGIDYEKKEADLDWLANEGHFPQKLDEVKLYEPSKTVKKPKRPR